MNESTGLLLAPLDEGSQVEQRDVGREERERKQIWKGKKKKGPLAVPTISLTLRAKRNYIEI